MPLSSSRSFKPFNSQMKIVILHISCQPYNAHNVSLENLGLDQLIIPKWIFFSVLITYLLDIILIL